MSIHAPRGVALQFNARQQAVQQERIRQGAVSGQPSEVHDHTDNANGINSSQFNYPQANQNVQQEDKNIFQQFGDWCKDVWEKSNPFFKVVEVALIAFVSVLAIRYTSMGVRAAVGGISGKLAGPPIHPFGNPNLSHSEKSLHSSIESTKKHYDAIERAKGEIAMYEDQISAATGDINQRNQARGHSLFGRILNPLQNQLNTEAKDDISRKNGAQTGLTEAQKSLREAQLNLRRAVTDQQEWRLRHSIDSAHSNIEQKREQLNHWKSKEKECRQVISNSSDSNYRKRLQVRLLEIEKYRESAEAEHNAAINLHQKLTEWKRISISDLTQDLDSSTGNINHTLTFPPEMLLQEYADTVGYNDELLQVFQKFNNHDIRLPDESPSQASINQFRKKRQEQGYHEPWWAAIARFFGKEDHLIPMAYRKPQAA